MRILFRINLYYIIMIDKYYLEGFVIGSIIYFLYFGINNRFKKSKKKNNDNINLLNYLKSPIVKISGLKIPNFINLNYFIIVNIFSYIYYKIKKYIKNRYI